MNSVRSIGIGFRPGPRVWCSVGCASMYRLALSRLGEFFVEGLALRTSRRIVWRYQSVEGEALHPFGEPYLIGGKGVHALLKEQLLGTLDRNMG